jgi:hypothetical protein
MSTPAILFLSLCIAVAGWAIWRTVGEIRAHARGEVPDVHGLDDSEERIAGRR